MISLTMSREDWRTGSIPELPLLRKQKLNTQKGENMELKELKSKAYDFVAEVLKIDSTKSKPELISSLSEFITAINGGEVEIKSPNITSEEPVEMFEAWKKTKF